jgi:hypothetical protein
MKTDTAGMNTFIPVERFIPVKRYGSTWFEWMQFFWEDKELNLFKLVYLLGIKGIL